MRKTKSKNIRKNNVFIGIGALVSLLFLLIASSFMSSLFMSKADRINILVFGEKTFLYSIDRKDSVHYAMYFYPDLKITVPKGYGFYRVGALGKLAGLEHNPDIFRQAFSYSTASFVPFYFYQNAKDVYYGGDQKMNLWLPGIKEILTYQSNTNFFDKIYLLGAFFTVKKADIQYIAASNFSRKENDTSKFMTEDFTREFQGFFYQAQYRREMKSVQIIYDKHYNTAKALSNILEGSGIRVVDISEGKTT